jgi:protease IV
MNSDSTPPSEQAAPLESPHAPAPPPSPSHPLDGTLASDSHWERETLQKLALASLEEQKKQRWWRVFFRFAWLILATAVLALSAYKGGVATSVSDPHTAVVQIKGEIAADSEASADSVIEALRSAFEEDSAKAVVLLINSPGGSPVQAGIINDEVKRLKALHNKPVYAVIEEMGASAAYYIAVSADKIYVDKASIVGSIGVLMDGFGFNGLMDKLGIERRLLTAGENKGFLDPFSAESKTQKAFALAMLEQIHQQFIAVVREGRGKRLHETPEIFSGLFWSGEESIKLGLADELGSLDYVAREVVKAEDVVDYTHRDNVAERLAKRFGAEMGSAAVKTLLSQNHSLK